MQSHPITTPNLSFFLSHHTSAALFISPQKRKKKYLDQFRPSLYFGPLPVGPLICTEYYILLFLTKVPTYLRLGRICLDSAHINKAQ